MTAQNSFSDIDVQPKIQVLKHKGSMDHRTVRILPEGSVRLALCSKRTSGPNLPE